jgi:DNA end-binding protein Ku
MAGGTIWKGIIHFGDTDVPVKLHSAVKEDRIQFHLLHEPDQVRVHQQLICALDKQPVPSEEQTKGFEVEEGKYILLDPEELERTVPESDRKILVHEFVKTGQIDPHFLDKVYYLGPDVQAKGYASLAEAMKALDVAGICTWTMRKRSYFGALEARGTVLRLNTLRYADEVVPVSSLDLRKVTLTEKELLIGSELIGKLTERFEPAKFENEHQKKLQAMIDKKARGENIVVQAPRRLKPTEPDNLLQVLEASLKKAA